MLTPSGGRPLGFTPRKGCAHTVGTTGPSNQQCVSNGPASDEKLYALTGLEYDQNMRKPRSLQTYNTNLPLHFVLVIKNQPFTNSSPHSRQALYTRKAVKMSSDNTSKHDDAKDTVSQSTLVKTSDEKKESVRPPTRRRRRKLKFFSPSTKVADLLSEAEEGRVLENRRVLTLIYSAKDDDNALQGTSSRVPLAATGILYQTPYNHDESPSIWLLANRWIFLPRSRPQSQDERCPTPKGVKQKLEEDIAYLKGVEVKELSHDELFEARYFLRDWVAQLSQSNNFFKYWSQPQSKVSSIGSN
ncbi:uncharacterized protein MELLADRAFT_109585 [Melampsora larici-populina 98AG31]|uniref:Uncharacterized protein n=1 Tax=Melampsora larici-populina (strain 98AG31 / pathotype 3-4-7) TaxID=747676 RepID=F4RWY8_MELLP|nr:uncharacterized protein MELLADRAFT_109585 [Melampsora larici-populina 98AG31]EGG03105.1 hypothetical protein MELLADRAFT_109585 [Melampsora larici-populina 98AG31]